MSDLDNYTRELLDEYKAYAQKSLRPKRIPIQPGLILTWEDSPIVPEKRKQKFYRSFVAKLQFAASWVCFHISYTVAQLARFCASAGSTHGAALHHLMEYLETGARSEFQADVSSSLGAQQWLIWVLLLGK